MSQRRNRPLARPTSMVIDQRTIGDLREDATNYCKSLFNKKSSLNRNSNSTVSSSISITLSNSHLSSTSSSSSSDVAINQLSITVSEAVMSPSSSSSTIASMVDTASAKRSRDPPSEKTRRRDILGRMKSSLDRGRNLPWNWSSKHRAQLSNSEPGSDFRQIPRTEQKNSSSTAFSLREMTRSASALFQFNNSKVSVVATSIAPSMTDDYASSFYSSTLSTSSPTSSVSSASSLGSSSPSPVRSHHEEIPVTIIEDEATDHSTSTSSLTAIARSRRNHGYLSRPQTIVGFFRQSRIFSSTSKSCDVFGMPLRDAVIMTRPEVGRDDSRYWLPAIVTSCINFLNQYGLEEEGLYRISGSVSGVEELKKEFAFYGQDMVLQPEVHDIHTIASLLKAYIRALPEALIPPSPQLVAILTQISEEVPYDAIQRLVATLPVYVRVRVEIPIRHFLTKNRTSTFSESFAPILLSSH
ncbi:Rho GTPase activation protein [Lipomyces chichibuensis]|uniref:Rho GTPase activation protein n=1 Tax=Lipomyces chichibuensis TaxID=1546026 RepID=UPI0033442AC5